MDTNTDIFPIYFQLIEQAGERTDAMVAEIKRLTQSFDIYDEVKLEDILQGPNSASERVLIYRIDTRPTANTASSEKIMEFLGYVFEKMFDKYPSYVEPPTKH